ncbi:MAG: hypothetical protein RLZZ141_1809 [Pseudomonadota bacterium]
MFANDLIASRLFGILVDEANRSAELDLLTGQFGYVDDLSPGDLILDLRDATFDEALTLFCGMVFSIFRQVAMAARF